MPSAWQTEPIPHAVVDGMWPASFTGPVAAEFPSHEDARWTTAPNDRERGKLWCDNPAGWGPKVKQAIAELRSDSCRDWLSGLTGIGGLSADTLGGGMHMTGPSGRLAMHRDFNVHPGTSGLERRLNVLLFLNPEWDKEWGGVLYLGEHKEVEVLPVAGRMAIFECCDASWHGHPEPVTGEHWRKSLAVYWYAPPTSQGSVVPHGTIWQE